MLIKKNWSPLPNFIYLGVALHLDGVGLVQNNSVIRSSATGRLGLLQCVSGSHLLNVGQWIAPDGSNLNNQTNGPFIIAVGDSIDPGFTTIGLQSGLSLSVAEEGVYKCVIPDQDGLQHYLHFGLYLSGFNGMLCMHGLVYTICFI